MDLTNRERQILKLVVESFVDTALPVSSQYLCKRYNLSYSSATVRNVMVDLEVKGLLSQPHVSAGRIPTDFGYRFYVNFLMDVERLSRQDRRRVLDKLRRVSRDVEHILNEASQILGEISNQLGIVLLPRFFEGIFDKLELVHITNNRSMLIIKIKSGLVKTIMLELEFDISRDTLESTASILNERLHGLTLGEIKNSIDDRLKTVSGGHPRLIRYFQTSAENLFDFDDWEEYYFGGTRNILRQPEFSDLYRVGNFIEFLENKQNIVQFLENISMRTPITISIGKENANPNLDECSIVSSDYRIGDVRGIISVIGPTRMDYGRMVSIVNYMSKAITGIVEN